MRCNHELKGLYMEPGDMQYPLKTTDAYARKEMYQEYTKYLASLMLNTARKLRLCSVNKDVRMLGYRHL